VKGEDDRLVSASDVEQLTGNKVRGHGSLRQFLPESASFGQSYDEEVAARHRAEEQFLAKLAQTTVAPDLVSSELLDIARAHGIDTAQANYSQMFLLVLLAVRELPALLMGERRGRPTRETSRNIWE
jgi:hypothetical protein